MSSSRVKLPCRSQEWNTNNHRDPDQNDSRMNKTMALRIAVVSVALSTMSVGASNPQAQGPRASTVKPAELTIGNAVDLWQEPWVFETRGAQRKALAALDSYVFPPGSAPSSN